MKILIISTFNGTLGLNLESLDAEITKTYPDYLYNDPLVPWDLIILNSEMRGSFKLLSRDLRQSLADNPAQRLIVLGTNSTLPPTLQGLPQHQAQPLTWQALQQDHDAAAKLYRELLNCTPVRACKETA